MKRAGSIPLEKEFKYTLSREEHGRILNEMRKKGSRLARSRTSYLDTPSLDLRKKGLGFRIRETDGKSAFLTLKLPTKPRRGMPRAYRIKEEYEVILPLATARMLLRGTRSFSSLRVRPLTVLRRFIPAYAIAELGVLGTMSMARVKGPLDERFVMELDRFQVFKKVFYELELETEEPVEAQKAIRRLFRRLHIQPKPSPLSKQGRFLAEWEKRSR